MGGNEDYFKREEDRKWRDKVDHEQVSLMTGFQVLDRRIDEMEDALQKIDAAVRGDPGEDRAGLLERIHEQEAKINRLWAVIFMDAAGTKGLFEEFKKLQRRESRWEINRTSLTAIAVAVISMLGLLLREWPTLYDRWIKDKPDKLERMIESAKGPKKRIRHVKVRVVPKEEPDDSPGDPLP